MPTPDLVTRPAAADELPAFFAALSDAFGSDPHEDQLEGDVRLAEPDRSIAVFDGDDIVGTAGAFTFDLTVPGGRVPAAGVTYVSVRSTHRRRGVLTGMMRRQLEDVHGRGEPVAVLWASEAAIYGRFGYGAASRLLRVEVDRVDARVRDDVPVDDRVRVRLLPPLKAAADIERVEHALVRSRPGTFARDSRWIEAPLHDPESSRGGMSRLRCMVAERDDVVVGYALFRAKGDSVRPHMLPDGEVLVMAQAALDPAASAALTRILLGMDLMRRVRWWNLPVDTALPHLLVDPRHARTTVVDALHLRVVDISAALSARRYLAPVDVVLEVSDPLCPWNVGRWRLHGDHDDARCEPTAEPADLGVPIDALGAAYLGGTSLTTLVATGRVTVANDDVLRRTSLAFGSDVEPWCPVIF